MSSRPSPQAAEERWMCSTSCRVIGVEVIHDEVAAAIGKHPRVGGIDDLQPTHADMMLTGEVNHPAPVPHIETLSIQRRVTTTFRQRDGRTRHVRKATTAEPELMAIYRALGVNPEPGGTRKLVA